MILNRKQIIKKKLQINKNRIQKGTVTSNNQIGEIKKRKIENISQPKSTNMMTEKQKRPSVTDLLIEKAKKTKSSIKKTNNISTDKRTLLRSGLDVNKKTKNNYIPFYKEYPPYKKLKEVDFDVAICISSYNRYEKVKKIIDQLYKQKSKYSFKIFLMNDGSTQGNYEKIKIDFSDIIYIENKKNGGKFGYWKTVSDLWSKVKEYKTHALCQMDDDFVLCNNFLNLLMDKFFEKKEENNGYMGFRYHNCVFNNIEYLYNNKLQGVDGGTLYDIRFIKMIDFSIKKTYVQNSNDSSRVWVNVTEEIREKGIKVYNFKKSLVFHDGNEDSKLNPKTRRIKKINTVNFIKNKNDFLIKDL